MHNVDYEIVDNFCIFHVIGTVQEHCLLEGSHARTYSRNIQLRLLLADQVIKSPFSSDFNILKCFLTFKNKQRPQPPPSRLIQM